EPFRPSMISVACEIPAISLFLTGKVHGVASDAYGKGDRRPPPFAMIFFASHNRDLGYMTGSANPDPGNASVFRPACRAVSCKSESSAGARPETIVSGYPRRPPMSFLQTSRP